MRRILSICEKCPKFDTKKTYSVKHKYRCKNTKYSGNIEQHMPKWRFEYTSIPSICVLDNKIKRMHKFEELI